MLYFEDLDLFGFPCQWDSFFDLKYQLQASFKRLSTNGQTAIYQVDKPDYSRLKYKDDNNEISYSPDMIEKKFPFEQLRAEFVDSISRDDVGGCVWFSDRALSVTRGLRVQVVKCEDDIMNVSFSMSELHRKYGKWVKAKDRI